ncbi:type VI secretion system tip protein VgrG (plasmid) [Deltaproteobacteria bacterium Smac51]|nr:type VI secretion system tip protein VgrG [Deltaproteobacteria bacterium Smac51]
MAALSANQGWFNISIEGGPAFEVYSFEGREKLNEPFEFTVELVSREADVDLIGLIGCPALLTAHDHSGGKRKVHGSIREAEQLHTGNVFTHYRIIIVPRLWYLGQNQNHRIFQNMTVVAIMEQIFKEQGFLSQAVSFKLKEKYEPREYCVQYAESDLYFISRLCEEEGLYYYFEHQSDSHILCFSDASGGDDIPDSIGGLLRFFPGSGQAADTAVITRLNVKQTVNSDQATYREWNFEKPPLDLEVNSSEDDQQKAPAPGGLKLETYQFPHLYNLKSPGQTYSAIQLKRQLTFARRAEGAGDVSRLLPGFAFQLTAHPRPDANAKWWLTEVHHRGEQPQVLEHEAPDRGFFYQNTFVAIPYETRFVPAVAHPKKRIEGLQSAIVTGPSSEEVYVDEYGRVKVHFHWDRLGPMTERSTCWVRVADGWAGHNFGFIQPPRIGQEVMVEFMEGDPDRPVITGRVYNAKKMPPWELPSQRVLSGLQSREFKGGQRNQVVMDDTAGQVQAQLSSDHQLSQLNLGYITRIDHIEGRKDFRGEGFELRTDGWGAIRAAGGLYLGTEARDRAESYHKDVKELANSLTGAAKQHEAQLKLTVEHQGQEPEDQAEISEKLLKQVEEIKGPGEPREEFTAPHLALSSPVGVALGTPASFHLEAGEHAAITSSRHTSLVSGRSLFASALDRVSIFAHKLGLKIFSGQGKLEIQSQANDLEIIADKVLKLISVKEKIELVAAKEIVLIADKSYIKIDGSGIEQGTTGQWTAKAAQHLLVGPASREAPLPELPQGTAQFNDDYRVINKISGQPIADMKYEIVRENRAVISGVTGEDGAIPLQEGLNPESVKIRLLGLVEK